VSTGTDEDTGRFLLARDLARIDERLARIESKIEAFEQAIGPMLANPGKILAKIMTGGK
jgi:hypothetical protein